jgi:cell division protein FtsI (penicillin-binding protein 3)
MIEKNNRNIVLEEYENEFSYKKSQSNLNIEFNRIAFIFFIIFTVSLIYSIQLIHLGSLQSNNKAKISSLKKKIIEQT